MSDDDRARMRDAMRDLMNPPAHLTVVESNETVILTADDGRVTRLVVNGKKVKDDATKIERKTKWDGGRLVSEVSGMGPTKMTETYTLDQEHHRLAVAIQMQNPMARQPRTVTRVYDADQPR
jgi:hypothetical protein